jgi:cysteine desulfurase/selenocysteine lyase
LNPAEVRELFPILQERTYLFSGGHSPASTPALEAVQRLMGEWADDTLDLYGRLHEEQDEVRRLFAGLIGAEMDEVAVLDSTGSGENLAVEMIPIPAHGNVVFDEWSYPSAVYPWMLPPREHLERRWVMSRGGVIELDDLEAAVDDDTVAVSISHVTQGEGFRQDLGAVSKLAHAHGALLLVDAAQSAGAVQIDAHAQGIDFLAAGACKWLLGAAGVAFFYSAKSHMQGMPPHAGAPSAANEFTSPPKGPFVPKAGAERFHLGIPNLLGIAATRPGLAALFDTGMERVESHVLGLSGRCIAGLQDRGIDVLTPDNTNQRGGVVAAVLDDAPAVEQFMRERRIDVYGGHTYNRTLRIDPHVFNNDGDIDTFLAAIDEYVAR